ncbi:MAG TPA: AAA family ATPase [Gemmatimonadaceae bacterium]|nr:AAA family ATPase [Gemmatimonadaceae bacterium]
MHVHHVHERSFDRLGPVGKNEALVLHARTLGELRLQDTDGSALTIRRKPLALLCYVVRHAPRPTSRTELATLFWGERGEDRARQSLRQTLLELKQAIGDRAQVDPESVVIAADAVELDITAFEHDIAAGQLKSAVEKWKGDFFEGSEDIGGEGFRRWIENERAGLHRHLSAAMERLIGDAEIRGDWGEACGLAERWAGALRFDERAHLRLIEVLRMSGRAAEAATIHAGFMTRLRTSLDVEPSTEFLRLGGGLVEDARAALARRGRGSAAVHTPQFVGRSLELGELTSAWETAREGTPVVVFIQGEGGSGLTRLAEELIAHVGPKAVVLRGRGKGETEPYSVASSMFEGLRDAEGSAGASPEALAEVARIVPSLKEQFRHLPAARGGDTALRDALAQTLAAISEETPVLVLVDDVQAADEATRQLVGTLGQRLAGGVLFVILANEADRTPGPGLVPLLETRGLRRLWLHALAAADVEAIVGSMVSLGADDRHRLATLIYQDTRGLAHHVCAQTAALVDEHLLTVEQDGSWRVSPALAGRPLPLPSSVRDRVKALLDRLTPDATAVAGTIAVLGGATAAAVIEDVSEVSPDATESALGELARYRLVCESEREPGHYEFVSPLIARAVTALVPATKRRALHTRAADVLVRRDLTATAERSLLPYHVARADSQPAAVPESKRRPAWAKRAAVIGGVVAAVAVVAVMQSKRFLTSGGDAAAAVPIVALGKITDYRDAKSPDLTKPLIDMLATNLGRVSGMRVVSTARMYELVSQNRPGSDSSAAVVAAARRAGATELVDGALYSLAGGGMRLDLRRVELATGNLRQSHSVNGATLFELADSGTARLAAEFGQTTPLGSVADVTTRSLTAYHSYEQGLRAYYGNDKRTAEHFFELALKEDSTFAMAAYYSALSVGGTRDLALVRFDRAARLAQHTTDRERLTILARQASVITSSPSLRALAETLTVRYPDEVEGYLFTGFSLLSDGEFLAALAPFRRVVAMDSMALTGARALCNACDAQRQIVSAYQLADSLEAAEREARRWTRLQPTSAVPWHTLADVLEQQGRFSDAMAALEKEAALDLAGIGVDRPGTLAMHQISVGEYDDADASLRSSLAAGSPETKRTALWYLAISDRYRGRLTDALQVARQYRVAHAGESVRGPMTPRNAAPTFAVVEAQVLFEMGRYREAAAMFDSTARWESPNEVQSQLGRSRAWGMTHAANALAMAGDTVGLAARADSVEVAGARSGFGRDRRLHHHVRGLLLAARGRDDAAVAELRQAIYSINMGYTRTNVVLAQVLMRQRKPAEAIAVLQPALRGTLEASNYYVTRTEVHDMLAQAWDQMPGPAARDSARAHYAVLAKAWERADASFSTRVAAAKSRLATR